MWTLYKTSSIATFSEYSRTMRRHHFVFKLSWTLLLVLSPKLLNFITFTPFLKSLHWLKINERINYKVISHTHINLLKLVNLLTSALFFHSLPIVVLDFPILSHLVAHLSPLDSKWILSSFCSCFMKRSPISSTSGCSSRHSFSYFKLASDWSFNLSFP